MGSVAICRLASQIWRLEGTRLIGILAPESSLGRREQLRHCQNLQRNLTQPCLLDGIPQVYEELVGIANLDQTRAGIIEIDYRVERDGDSRGVEDHVK